jgi:hypothetical protein
MLGIFIVSYVILSSFRRTSHQQFLGQEIKLNSVQLHSLTDLQFNE